MVSRPLHAALHALRSVGGGVDFADHKRGGQAGQVKRTYTHAYTQLTFSGMLVCCCAPSFVARARWLAPCPMTEIALLLLDMDALHAQTDHTYYRLVTHPHKVPDALPVTIYFGHPACSCPTAALHGRFLGSANKASMLTSPGWRGTHSIQRTHA